jgi:hypothetical protein
MLFILGLGTVAACYFLIDYGKVLDQFQIYMWVSIGVMYVIFFCPFFFSHITVKNLNGKIPSLTMVWLGEIVFLVISIGITISVCFHVLQVSIAIGIELILFFLLLADIYFGYFANSHVQSVEQNETQSLGLIKQIRVALDSVNLKVPSLNDSYAAEKKQIAFLAEEVHYISPVDNITESAKLELDILGKITAVSSACDATLSGGDGAELRKQIAALDLLIKQRKLMKN